MQILLVYLKKMVRDPGLGARIALLSFVMTFGWLIQRGDCRDMLEHAELVESAVHSDASVVMCEADDQTRHRAQEALEDRGYEVTLEAFFDAWSRGDVDAMEYFWQSDVVEEEQFLHLIIDREPSVQRQTLLRNAVVCGANLEGEDQRGRTPLIYATVRGQMEDVRFLLDQGAELEAEGDAGYGVLHGAATRDDAEMTTLLVERGAEVEATDDVDGTPLHYAAGQNSESSAKVLVEYGADVDFRSRDRDRTPLHFAVVEGHTDMVGFLVDEGADPELADSNGHRPLHLAVLEEHRGVAHELVEEHGVELNPLSVEEATPLDYAVRRGLREWFVPFLANRGGQVVTEEDRYE